MYILLDINFGNVLLVDHIKENTECFEFGSQFKAVQPFPDQPLDSICPPSNRCGLFYVDCQARHHPLPMKNVQSFRYGVLSICRSRVASSAYSEMLTSLFPILSPFTSAQFIITINRFSALITNRSGEFVSPCLQPRLKIILSEKAILFNFRKGIELQKFNH